MWIALKLCHTLRAKGIAKIIRPSVADLEVPGL
jgi:hypothetical protein